MNGLQTIKKLNDVKPTVVAGEYNSRGYRVITNCPGKAEGVYRAHEFPNRQPLAVARIQCHNAVRHVLRHLTLAGKAGVKDGNVTECRDISFN